MKPTQNIQTSKVPTDFIPARESKPVISFFKWYTYLLCKRRLANVWIHHAEPVPDNSSVLYVVNHHSWWDGLVPLLLNEFVFHKRARALMEDKQMRQFSFFSKIGAMSINRKNVRSAVYSLQEASKWLREDGTSLFLFPEGKITNPAEPIQLEGGVLRILKGAPGCVLVPISLYFSFQRSDKPELFVSVESPLTNTATLQLEDIQAMMQAQLNDLRRQSMQPEHGFQKLI
ncbi:MAG: lysophospholipid acyltransferase family protein [Bacteroidetes bacterium]|nr:lysophospholipid acyltransferase family protein [Bacteroidota bacterium]